MFFSFGVFFCSLGETSASGNYKIFRNSEGTAIEARVIEVHEDTVEIERVDGLRFTAAIDLFSGPDQEYFRVWRERAILRNEHNWNIGIRSVLDPQVRTERRGYTLLEQDAGYEISLTNRTSEPFRDLVIRYRVFIEDTDPGAMRNRRNTRHFDGLIDVEELPFREEMKFLTGKGTLRQTRLHPGFRWGSGAPPNSRDRLRGIFFQIVADEEVVQTVARPSTLGDEMEAERPPMFFPKRHSR